jgi:hypothetical protein
VITRKYVQCISLSKSGFETLFKMGCAVFITIYADPQAFSRSGFLVSGFEDLLVLLVAPWEKSISCLLEAFYKDRLQVDFQLSIKGAKQQWRNNRKHIPTFSASSMKKSVRSLSSQYSTITCDPQPRFPLINCKISPKAHLSSHSPRIMLRNWCTKPKKIQAPCTRTRSYLFHPNELDLIPWRA